MTLDISKSTVCNQPATPCAFEEISPSDRDLYEVPDGLYVGIGGALSVIGEGEGDEHVVTFQNVPSGTFLRIRVKRVTLASTCSNIIALYS